MVTDFLHYFEMWFSCVWNVIYVFVRSCDVLVQCLIVCFLFFFVVSLMLLFTHLIACKVCPASVQLFFNHPEAEEL